MEDQRLKLTHQEFKKDCEELLEFYPVFFNVINALSSIKQYYDVLLPAIEDIGKENFSANKQLLLAVEDQKIQEAIAALTKYE